MTGGKPSARRTTGIHIALLRAVNVGGKRSLPMSDLVAMFEKAGCRDVQSYIQSGNVVFRAEPALAQRLPVVVGRAIMERFGFEAPILTRSVSELSVVASRNPFLAKKADPVTLHVVFLLDRPVRGDLALLDPQRSPPDEFVPRGREIYLRCPNGLGRSRLTAAYFDSVLKTVSTTRNWNTVLKLLELARVG